MENGSAVFSRRLQDLYSVLSALGKELLRQLPIGNDNVNIRKPAEAKTAFYIYL